MFLHDHGQRGLAEDGRDVDGGANSQRHENLCTQKPGQSEETTTALPVAYEVTLRLARKPDFTPETGKSYNLKATFEYAINLEGKDGKPFDGVSDVSSSTDIIHMEGLDAAYIDQFFDEYLLGGDKVFPMTLSFKVYREGNHYVIKHPMER